MNNRYTFKAKRKDNGEWITGYYMYSPHDCKNYIFNGNNGYGLNDCREFEYYEIIPETISQCTGLQDRDGNYIFENDIVDLNNIEFRVDYSYGSFEFSHDANIDKNCDDADYINPIDYKVDECKIIRSKFDKEVE